MIKCASNKREYFELIFLDNKKILTILCCNIHASGRSYCRMDPAAANQYIVSREKVGR